MVAIKQTSIKLYIFFSFVTFKVTPNGDALFSFLSATRLAGPANGG
jgi:hypothetical protein